MPQDNNDEVCILLGVWGKTFIKDFLNLSLPSLLAAGNIPALAKAYKTRFVFLTIDSVELFESNHTFQRLKSVCDVEFIFIEDLIGFGNYSTTLTLAYDRAIKHTKEKMLNTYFVFLTSDYIMADGSLEGLIRYIKQGYSGICAGNFQVIKEKMKPYLLNRIDPTTHTLTVKPRELLEVSFQHLHQIVFASMFEQTIVHNPHVNRFFFRYSHQIMAGRFYLLHMLCIKPETMDYQVGSSCDYSFIPELCPSGNVAVISDSDDYLVVEVQSRFHEASFIKTGSYQLNELARHLGEWTTSRHRENAQHTIYYHTRDLTPSQKMTIDQRLQRFILEMQSRLETIKAPPHREHPYWIGALNSLQKDRKSIESGQTFDDLELKFVKRTGLVKRMYHLLVGTPPKVYPWHYRWLEFRDMLHKIHQHINGVNKENIIVIYSSHYHEFNRYYRYLQDVIKITHHYDVQSLKNPSKLSPLQLGQFKTCLFFVTLEEYKKIKPSLFKIKKMLRQDGKCLVLIPNQFNYLSRLAYEFENFFTRKTYIILGVPFYISNIDTIRNNLTLLGGMTLVRVNHLLSNKKIIWFLGYALIGLPCSLVFLLMNGFKFLFKKNKGHCTNIILTLTPADESATNK